MDLQLYKYSNGIAMKIFVCIDDKLCYKIVSSIKFGELIMPCGPCKKEKAKKTSRKKKK